jgi:M-phase inducer tyrosine phosphatase
MNRRDVTRTAPLGIEEFERCGGVNHIKSFSESGWMSIFQNAGEIFERIDGNALCNLLQDKGTFDKVVVVDCRGDYEFRGGHIKVAVNAQSEEDLKQIYDKFYTPNTCFVFHCEYSQIRGPSRLEDFFVICELRDAARPKCYVLDGGYRSFYKHHKDQCGKGYTEEHSKA